LNRTVSVIVRTVRRPQRLRECLQSLAAQTFRNFELVLIDMIGGLTSTIVEGIRENLPALRRLKLNGACSR
jgi:GT2 family glycosyltransferase